MYPGKVLFSATIAKHILRFHLPYLKWFKDNGYEVHVAANGEEDIPYCDVKHSISFVRRPFALAHFRAYRELKEVIDRENYQLIHCHTPMGGVITRLASRYARRKGAAIIYTAHGFHYFRGSSLYTWLTYFPVEVCLSYFTDVIVTINREDYGAIKWPYAPVVKYLVHGMGVDQDRFRPLTIEKRIEERKRIGLASTDFVLIYVGEFIERKNHEFILRAVPVLRNYIPYMRVLFAGRGELLEEMKRLAIDLSIESEVSFLGFREDVNVLMGLSDIGISASKQEGLGLNLAEEMMCGLPIVATVDRGHRELIEPNINGFLFEQNDLQGFIEYVVMLSKDSELRKRFSVNSIERATSYSLTNTLTEFSNIYINCSKK